LLRAGNQQGKTFAGAMEMATHLTGRYPPWWAGRRFDHAIDAWAACDTGETTRDNPQRALLGAAGSWEGGAIPQDAIVEAKRGRGVADLLDIVLVRHVSGGTSRLGFKRYDQGREAWQGPAKHVIWCDEEPPQDVYGEALARLISTRGIIYTTFTPLKGMSDVVERLMHESDGVTSADVNVTRSRRTSARRGRGACRSWAPGACFRSRRRVCGSSRSRCRRIGLISGRWISGGIIRSRR